MMTTDDEWIAPHLSAAAGWWQYHVPVTSSTATTAGTSTTVVQCWY
jgi:hypothetical protein